MTGWQDIQKFWQDTVFLIEGTKALALSLDIFQPLRLIADFMPGAEAVILQPREKGHRNQQRCERFGTTAPRAIAASLTAIHEA